MFANLTYQDKEAFFSLLDEYFASRPHLVSGSGGSSASPVQQLQTIGRFLSPPPSASSANSAPKTEADVQREAKEAQRIDQVSRLAMKGLKSGSAGATKGIGMLSRNEKAMGALDKYGAGVFVRGAEGIVGKKSPGVEAGDAGSGAIAGAPSPPPSKKGGGVGGLVSTKSFGHVDTSSKMGAFTSMFRDPQKAAPPTANTPTVAALPRARDNLPPPPRRTGSAAAPVAQEPEPVGAEGQAQAIYDYSGADSGDLSVQDGQIVNVLEKTSVDYGNGKRGLVPANYLREI